LTQTKWPYPEEVLMIPRYFKQFLAVALMLIGAIVTQQPLYAQCIPPPSGMTTWWPLDEAAGPTANDIAAGGVNNAGTWMNSPVPVAGEVGGALTFSGSNSVDVPDHSELNFGTGDFSIDLWIKTTNSSGTRTILDKRTSSGPNPTGYLLFLVNGNLSSQIGDGTGYNNCVTTGFVADGNWHHVALTVDRNNSSGWRHYVDGNILGTIGNPTGYQGSLTNTAPLVMARNLLTPSQSFAGTLDEISLFNRVLDSLEIRSIWAAGSFGKCKETCHATGDANNDGIPLSVGDMSYLVGFINFCGPAPAVLYSCDLNGDGYVNSADLQLYVDYFTYGLSVFAPYGGYPVLCPCNPIPAPVPDTVNIFGLEHTSLGTACLETVENTLKATRLGSSGEDGLAVDLEDRYTIWEGEMEDPDADSSLAVGASLQLDFYGVVGGESDQHQGYWRLTKVDDEEWELNFDFAADLYTVEAYNGSRLVFYREGVEAQYLCTSRAFVPHLRWPWYWGKSGWNRWVRRHESGRWKADSELLVERYEYGRYADSGTFNWESQGIHDLTITHIAIIPETPHAGTIPLSSVSVSGRDIYSLSIVSESAGLSYRGIACTNLGNASLEVVDTTLVVHKVGSSGNDGLLIDTRGADGWNASCLNVDSTGTATVGAFVSMTLNGIDTSGSPEALATVMVRMAPSQLEVSADYSPLGCDTFSIEVYDGSQLVAEVTGLTGSAPLATMAAGNWALDWHKVPFPSGSPESSVYFKMDVTWIDAPGGPVFITVPGAGTFQGDRLRVIGMLPQEKPKRDTVKSIVIRAKDLNHIIFTSMSLVFTSVPGDANGDAAVNISDAVYLIAYIFAGGLPPNPLLAGDANCDSAVNISDAVYLIAYIFVGGAAPCAAGK
jgi:hypothetical protein